MIPTIHITPKQADTFVPFVLVNLSTESLFLSKNEYLDFLDKIDICGITTGATSEPFTFEVTAEQPKRVPQSEEGKFIYTSANIFVHREVDLHDADVRKEI